MSSGAYACNHHLTGLCGSPRHPIVVSSSKMHYASLVHTQQPFVGEWELIIIAMVSIYHFANGAKTKHRSLFDIKK